MIKKTLRATRDLFLKPSVKIGLGILVTGGFIAGAASWQGFNTALEVTNSEEFCLSCHTMRDNMLPELQKTVHWSNRSGVRAECQDCHVPHEFTDKIARKMQASREVWGQLVGTIGTREKFEEHRVVLARREWARMEANDSRECRACHDYKDMDINLMRPTSQVAMRAAAERDESCISCHKGIAHHLPDLKGTHNPAFDTLVSAASSTRVKAEDDYYAVLPHKIYADAELTQEIGSIEVAAKVTVLEANDDAQRVELDLWRKNKGFGRVWYSNFGLNITSAILSKEVSRDENLVSVLESKEDPATGLEWQNVKAEVWMPTASLIDSPEEIWEIAAASYNQQCSTCHRQPEVAHFDANSWPAQFGGMVGFTSMDDDTAKMVLKYLQKHSSDFIETAHGGDPTKGVIQSARP
ncbi:pentaheme c-type cytochrome TorC [Aliiroseovarius sp. S1339]|uniref:pentaheme c-type cytochrome TorC n=1 Tax=Aliiroseovarius sp. S1339 TaxID=2936990 RepID=UPI0020C06285|nr:pentaheme c-type cytochrome TorC [Aliiroseovarius sp. S1339]MCK8462898.1 pentaheme c-type cytochrome TorC [Aliiroseovarius sp. S1339]